MTRRQFGAVFVIDHHAREATDRLGGDDGDGDVRHLGQRIGRVGVRRDHADSVDALAPQPLTRIE